jgi:hypothetical protein
VLDLLVLGLLFGRRQRRHRDPHLPSVT